VTAPPTAVVTGANSGIGLETTRGLARAGMHVVMLCRNEAKAVAAKADIEASVPDASLSIVLCDLSLQADVRRAAEEIEAHNERLDLLVNNAGIMLRSRQDTPEGVEMMLAVNHVGPFLLATLLLPLLQASTPARIVNIASEAHEMGKLDLDDLQAARGYGRFGIPRYSETKLMNILFTRELARRIEGTGVTANSLHPGVVRTNLGNPPAPIRLLGRLITVDAVRGAETTLAAATMAEYAEFNGSYFIDSQPADNKLSVAAQDDDAAVALWAATEALLSRRHGERIHGHASSLLSGAKSSTDLPSQGFEIDETKSSNNETRSARFWDRRAATYAKTEVENEQLHTTIVERSREYLDTDQVVLDLGCGTGALTYKLAPHVKALHGLDVSSQMIEIATDRADGHHVQGLHFAQGSIFDDSLAPESFDTILAFQVLHVLSNKHEVLRRIHELLKPGGWFVSATPCMGENQSVMKLINRALLLARAVRIIPYGKFFAPSELERSISDGGFEIDETANLPFDQRADMRRVLAHFVAAKKIR